MRFPYAYKGVKKIFSAQILSLIATAAGIAAIFAAIAAAKKGPAEAAVSDVLLLVALVIGAVSGIVALVALILNLVGIVQAKKDEPSFGKALICTLIALAATAFSVGFTRYTHVKEIFDLIADLAQACAIIFTVVGIQMLADALVREDIRNLGRFICRLLCWAYTIMLAANVSSLIFAYLPDVVTFGSWLSLISEIMKMVAYIVYLIFLGKAVKMLRA